MTEPRISFGVIVLNGEPFTRYCLRALYPFAHQIIVAEGAAPGARGNANDQGHSSDGTLDVLRAFKSDEDPEAKLTIVTAEDEGHPDGFWPGEKDEQSRAYARRATGDYLWQVDIDEFYRAADMQRVIDMLAADPAITGMAFRQHTFWGGFRHAVDGPFLRYAPTISAYHRLFKWGPGYTYASHRPPTVLDERGRDMRAIHYLDGGAVARAGVRMYHYSLVFPKQVTEKCRYYATASWLKQKGAEQWAREVYANLERPFRVHNVFEYPSWLVPYEGEHPEAIDQLQCDVEAGKVDVELRGDDDAAALVTRTSYRLKRRLLLLLMPLYWLWFRGGRTLVRMLLHPRWAMSELRKRAAGEAGRVPVDVDAKADGDGASKC